MFRRPGSNARGAGFSHDVIVAVWCKTNAVQGNDPAVWRKDQCGAFIRFGDYGSTDSKYGWEIDHIKPVALGGGDEPSNLQALQWENNRHKSDSYPHWFCKVRAA
jgi:5-methylcytosine-specific restriction endonuclease McrA